MIARLAPLWASFKVRLALVVGLTVLILAVLTTSAAEAGAPPYVVITVSVLAALVVTHALARGLTAPVREMTRAAGAMARGDYRTRVAAAGPDEIGDLARAFNTMAADLEREDQQRRDLIATVSHELRTPVAALRATLENLADGIVTGPDEVGGALHQTERLAGLVSDLLDLSRLDAGLVPLEVTSVNVEDLLREVAEEARLADRAGTVASYDVQVAPGLTVDADRARLHQLLANLVDNAVRHSPPGGTVSLRARAAEDAVVLEVADQGPGIPPERRGSVFHRFATSADLAATHQGGTGLGLAIAHWVAVLHGGRIGVADDAGPGCVIRVEIPRHPPSRPLPPSPIGAAMTAPPATPPATLAPPAPPAGVPSGPGGMDRAFAWWPERHPAARPDLVLLALGVGLLAGIVLVDRAHGLGTWLVLVGMAGVGTWAGARRFDRFGWACLALAGALVTTALLRDAGWIVTLAVLNAGLLVAIAFGSVRTFLGFLAAQFVVPLAGIRGLPWLGRSMDRAVGRTGWPVARVALLTGALVLLFGTLLGSADALYGAWLDRLVPDIRTDTLFGRAFLTALVGGVTLAGAYVALNPPKLTLAASKTAGRPRWEWLLPVLAVDLLLLGFGVAQATALFGGHDYVAQTTGLTYAEYARAGFGQLCAVTLLTVAVVAGAWRTADTVRDRTALRVGLGLLCALTLGVVASALVRLGLYAEAYGYTRLRLLVGVFEGWLGLVLLLIVAAGVLWKVRWLAPSALVTGSLALLGLAVINPDAWIAEHNLARSQATTPRDDAYLTGLSADAVPVLPDALRDQVCVERSGFDDDDFWEWNLGRSRAAAACR